MTDFIGGYTFKRGDAASPEVFTTVSGLISLSGFGKANELIRVTDFDSTAHEYIPGLSDGEEPTADFHDDLDPATNTALAALKADVDSGTNRNIQIIQTDGTNTETYDFAVVPLSWTKAPSFEDANTITFALKITGAIVET